MISSFFTLIRNRGLLTMAVAILRLFIVYLETLILSKKFVLRNVHNYKMLLDVKDRGLSRALILFKKREVDHQILLGKILKPNMRVFDIGANIGYYALMELNILEKASQLCAFEPVSSNVKLLNENLKLNGYEVPTVLNAAISSFDGEKDFFFSTASNLGSLHKLDVNQGENSAGVSKVQTISLRSACLNYGSPDLIRMDVEGHEVEILTQLVQLVLEGITRPTVIFETHLKQYKKDDKFSSTLEQLFENGYRVSLFASSQASGTEIIKRKGYSPFQIVRTDGMKRALFENLSNVDAVELITKSGGIRTVVLSYD